MLSDEVDDFRREIQIDADATFFDLHEAILASTKYKDGEMSSFFICDNDWSKEKEITLTEMDTSSEEDSFIMSDSVLNDFLEDEKQKLMYVFDYMTERAFFMELREIIPGKSLAKAICSRSEGQPPVQHIDFNDFDSVVTKGIDTGESFYGDEGYDLDELDAEGFDGLDNDLPLPDDDNFQ